MQSAPKLFWHGGGAKTLIEGRSIGGILGIVSLSLLILWVNNCLTFTWIRSIGASKQFLPNIVIISYCLYWKYNGKMDDIFKIIPSLLTIIVTTERVTNHNNQWIPPSLQKEWQTHDLKRFRMVKESSRHSLCLYSLKSCQARSDNWGEDDFSCNGQPRLYQDNIRTAIHYW